MNIPNDLHLAGLPAILAERGVEIGYRLTVAAPKGAVDDNLKHLLARHKPALVEALARADGFGNPAVTYADVLTWDRQEFDWATGEQRGDDAGLDELAEVEAVLDAITTEGEKFTRVDPAEFDVLLNGSRDGGRSAR